MVSLSSEEVIEAGVERRLYDSALLSVKTITFVNSGHICLLGVILSGLFLQAVLL